MSEQTASQPARGSRSDARRWARHQVIGLSLQFLLGMAVSLIGQPSQTTGTAHTASNILLGLHILVAVGLVANAVIVVRAARNGSARQRQLARWAAVLIALTFAAGVLTLITKSNWWSYGMSIGFITSLGLYVAILVQAAAPGPHEQPAKPASGEAA
jgi:cytochrome bd-type quinol oxidase subunit 2